MFFFHGGFENTEQDWLPRYIKMYGASVYDKTEEEIIDENEDAKKFSEQTRCC
jgi:hypothetical protein